MTDQVQPALTRQEEQALWACLHEDRFGPYVGTPRTALVNDLQPWEIGALRDSAMAKIEALLPPEPTP